MHNTKTKKPDWDSKSTETLPKAKNILYSVDDTAFYIVFWKVFTELKLKCLRQTAYLPYNIALGKCSCVGEDYRHSSSF